MVNIQSRVWLCKFGQNSIFENNFCITKWTIQNSQSGRNHIWRKLICPHRNASVEISDNQDFLQDLHNKVHNWVMERNTVLHLKQKQQLWFTRDPLWIHSGLLPIVLPILGRGLFQKNLDMGHTAHTVLGAGWNKMFSHLFSSSSCCSVGTVEQHQKALSVVSIYPVRHRTIPKSISNPICPFEWRH